MPWDIFRISYEPQNLGCFIVLVLILVRKSALCHSFASFLYLSGGPLLWCAAPWISPGAGGHGLKKITWRWHLYNRVPLVSGILECFECKFERPFHKTIHFNNSLSIRIYVHLIYFRHAINFLKLHMYSIQEIWDCRCEPPFWTWCQQPQETQSWQVILFSIPLQSYPGSYIKGYVGRWQAAHRLVWHSQKKRELWHGKTVSVKAIRLFLEWSNSIANSANHLIVNF